MVSLHSNFCFSSLILLLLPALALSLALAFDSVPAPAPVPAASSSFSSLNFSVEFSTPELRISSRFQTIPPFHRGFFLPIRTDPETDQEAEADSDDQESDRERDGIHFIAQLGGSIKHSLPAPEESMEFPQFPADENSSPSPSAASGSADSTSASTSSSASTSVSDSSSHELPTFSASPIRLSSGTSGETWLVFRAGRYQILKRLFAAPRCYKSGLREIYVGSHFRAFSSSISSPPSLQPHLVSRFLDWFSSGGQLFLLFEFEGISLNSLLNQVIVDPNTHSVTVKKSAIWNKMKENMRNKPESADHGRNQQSGVAGEHQEIQLKKRQWPIDEISVLQLPDSLDPSRSLNSPSDLPRSAEFDSNSNSLNIPLPSRLPFSLNFRLLFLAVVRSVAFVNLHGIIHRDIKPSNLLIRPRGSFVVRDEFSNEIIIENSSADSSDSDSINIRLADFGSAVFADEQRNSILYPNAEPTSDEQTEDYSPPESLLLSQAYSKSNPIAYDSWSVGVLAMELLLGDSKVFKLDDRSRAILRARMQTADEQTIKKAEIMKSLEEYGIINSNPTVHSHSHSNAEFDHSTNPSSLPIPDDFPDYHLLTGAEQKLFHAIKKFDPDHIGLNEMWGIKLIHKLLSFEPENRIHASRALGHAFFEPHRCKCGREFEFDEELKIHQNVENHGIHSDQ